MHYITNTVYHASARDCWGYLAGEQQHDKEGLLLWNVTQIGSGYIHSAIKPDLSEYYEIKPVLGEGKEPDLNAARHSAIWPEATDNELYADDLKERLEARLPGLLAEFQKTMENLGFTF